MEKPTTGDFKNTYHHLCTSNKATYVVACEERDTLSQPLSLSLSLYKVLTLQCLSTLMTTVNFFSQIGFYCVSMLALNSLYPQASSKVMKISRISFVGYTTTPTLS